MRGLVGLLFRPKPEGTFTQKELQQMIAYEKRKQNDCMPAQWHRKPIVFHAFRWITGHRELPRVRGRLQ